MDIQKISQEVEQQDIAAPVPIFKRDGEPDLASDGTQTTFMMLGRDSKKVRAVVDRQTREWARHRGPIDPKVVYEKRVEIAIAALVAWPGVEDGGKPFPLTPDNARLVFADRHYLEQAEEGVNQHARFFTKAS